MPTYSYIVIDDKGKRLQGRIEKDNLQDAKKYLKNQNYDLIEITKKIQLDFFNGNRKLSDKELAVIAKQLYFTYKSGLSIIEGLDLIINGFNKKIFIKSKFIKIRDDILRGMSIADSFDAQKIFPSFFINFIRVGQESGEMDSTFSYLHYYYEKSKKYNEEIKNMFVYPTIVLIALLVSFVLISVFFLPNYLNIFRNSGLETPTALRFLHKTNLFFSENFIFVWLALLMFVLAVRKFFKSKRGIKIIDRFLVKNFLSRKVYLKLLNYRFSNALKLLYDSGVPIVKSIEILKGVVNNTYLDNDLDEITLRINQGNNLSESLERYKYFDAYLLSFVKSGEVSGSLSQSLETASDFLKDELDITMEKLNKLIEPTVNIILGILIFLLMMAVVLPSISLGTQMM